MLKTNVMKILEQNKIEYSPFIYNPEITDGIRVAEALNEDKTKVFKTLVTVDNTNHYLVFVIPVALELDLKKAAKALNKKSIDMIKQKDLKPLTGYIHGGCSPIGMKKLFPTYIDESAQALDLMYVSAGLVGYQIAIKPSDLLKMTKGKIMDLTKEKS